MAAKNRHENLGWGNRDARGTGETVPAPPSRFGNWFARLFCLPHILIGIWLAYMCFINIMPVAFGTDVQGHVATLAPREGRRKTTYHVTFNFPDGDKTTTSAATIDRAFYLSLKEGSPLPVRYWSLAKGPTAYIAYPGHNHFNMFLLFFTLFWDSIMSLIFFAFYISPLMVALGIWKEPVST